MMNSRTGCAKRRDAGSRGPLRGFTLVELLVVIGIIALLISILLPSLNKARQQAQTLKCLANLRQIGMAFQFYEGEYKSALPCVRMDTPDGPDSGFMPVNSTNRYWPDVLIPYISKTAAMNFQLSANAATAQQQISSLKKSVFWCPSWPGWPAALGGSGIVDDVSRYECGYAMNYWPTITPSYPKNPSDLPPSSESQIRSTVITVGTPSNAAVGRYHKLNDWRHAGDKMLVCDANLWLLGFQPVASPGAPLIGQNALRAFASAPGSSNIDRYRHGKTPSLADATTFQTRGGDVRFNVLFVDGHATTLIDSREGYKTIRMIYP